MGVPRFLLLVSLAGLGVAGWGWMGLESWIVSRRPALVVEAFLEETSTTAQIDELAQKIQAGEYFQEIRYVDPEEARAEAGMIERIKPLLDAYGGNPFLRSLRMTVRPQAVERCAEGAAGLKELPLVVSVRAPVAQAERLLEAEGRLRRVAGAAAAALASLAFLVALAALGLRVPVVAPELEVFERLGASSAQIARRVFRRIAVPVVLGAVAVALALEAASAAARFSGRWLEWPGARLPEFPHLAGAFLVAGALVLGLAASVKVCLTRPYSRLE